MRISLLTALAAVLVNCCAAKWELPEQPTPLACNPAVHCLPGALECISADVDIEGNIPYDFNVLEQTPGFCTEVFRPKCKWVRGTCIIKDPNKKNTLSPEQAQGRCAQLMVTPASRLNKVNKLNYNSACMEGYYTCFDGSCGGTEKACQNRCEKQKCTVPPIRYGPDRCEYDCRTGPEEPLSFCPVPSGKNTTVKDHCVQLPFRRPEPEFNITIVEQLCCNPGPYEERYPPFTVTFEAYENEPCCPNVENVDFADISNDYTTSDDKGTFNIYPIKDLQPEDKMESFTVNISFAEPTSGADCCCNLLCTCAGDPHCSSFDGTQAVSRVESGSLNMITEGDFSLYTSMGVDGIIDEITITLPGFPKCSYHLKAQNAQENKWFRTCEGGEMEKVPVSEIPPPLVLNLDFDAGDFCDSETQECTENGGTLKIGSKLMVVIFLRKFTPLNTNKKALFRFDVEVQRFTGSKVETEDGLCCPGPETALPRLVEQLKVPSGGFCYDPQADDVVDFFRKNGVIYPKDTRRRLDSADDDVSGRELADTTNLNKVEACDNYMRIAIKLKGKDLDRAFELQQCINEFIDYGAKGVRSLIASLKASKCRCIKTSDITCAPTFKKPLSACNAGVTLEARNKDSSDTWQFVRAFPANKDYCDDLITINFVGENKLDFDYEGVPTYLDISVHDVRFVERTDTPEECNQCTPRETVDYLDVSARYSETVEVIVPNTPEPVKCYLPSTGCRDCDFLPIPFPGN